jgi:ABC-2 type transport system permease protein
LNTIVGLLKLFIINSKIRISRSIQYRFDFIAGIIVSLGLSSIGPVVQLIIFTRTNGYPGWELKQIILFQGVLLLWLGLKDMLFGSIRPEFDRIIRNGEFDRLLLKPYPPIGVILTGGFYYYGIGPVLAGLAVITYSCISLGQTINPLQILLFLGFMLLGIIFYLGILVFYCVITVRLYYTGRLSEIFDKFLTFSQYPVEIFNMILRVGFLTVIPLAIWVYFPAQSLLNRLDITALIGAIFSLLTFLVSLRLWNYCLMKYSSAGG